MSATGRWRQALVVSLVLFVVVCVVSLFTSARVAALRISDTLIRVAPVPAQQSNVILVLIDDEALQRYGRWPWPRTLLAQLVRKLKDSGAQVVGLDILLSEPESAETDRVLAKALSETNSVIVDKIGSYQDGPHWIEPLPDFSRAASAIGHAQAVLDVDGVCRRFPPRELTMDGMRWAFSVEVAKRVDPSKVQAFLNAYGLADAAGQGAVRTIAPRLIRVPYRRDGFQTVSAARLLESQPASQLQGKWVLVGFGPTEIADRINTPLSAELPTPGVEVHAQILDGIACNRLLREMPLWAIALILAGTCVASAISVQRWNGWKAIVWMTCACAVAYLLSLLLFAYAGWIAPVGGVLFVIALAPFAAYASDFIVVERTLNRQFRELQRWLASHANTKDSSKGGVFWRLELVRELQSQLGALYELQNTLLETTPDPVGIFDAHGNLMFHNRRFRECFDRSDLTFPEFRQMVESSADGTFEQEGTGFVGEMSVRGEPHTVRTAALPVTTLTPSGGTLVVLASLKMREERDRARAEALGFVTHELRTPITAIQGFAELMMRYPGSPSSTKAPETILRESKRLLALIHNYLDVLRLDAGARPIRQEPVSLDDVIRGTCELVQPLASAEDITIQCQHNVHFPITGDRALIEGAALNLISNAIKYSRRGSTVTVGTAGTQDAVTLSVHNASEPIAPEDLTRIFETFYRSPKTEHSLPGWGLGLAFVKRIAEKHGGSVHATSGPEGTIFAITLPTEQRATAKGAA